MNKLLFFSKGLLLLCLFATSFVKAQTVSTEYATQINSTFANLDKTKIPQKLLQLNGIGTNISKILLWMGYKIVPHLAQLLQHIIQMVRIIL